MSSKNSTTTSNAAKAVKTLLSFFPPTTISDQEAYTAAMVQLFSNYPPSVIRGAIDPTNGLPAMGEFAPSLKAAKEFLEKLSVQDSKQRERLETKTLLGDFEAPMRQSISPENFWSWFSQARLVAWDANSITLAVRSPFFRNEIRKRFEQNILRAAGVRSLVLKVDASLQDVNRGPAPDPRDVQLERTDGWAGEPPSNPEMKQRVDALFADLVAHLTSGKTNPAFMPKSSVMERPRVFIPASDHRYPRFIEWAKYADGHLWQFGQSSDGRDGMWVDYRIWAGHESITKPTAEPFPKQPRVRTADEIPPLSDAAKATL